MWLLVRVVGTVNVLTLETVTSWDLLTPCPQWLIIKGKLFIGNCLCEVSSDSPGLI